jgi:putative effector of murein hydrolase LrgA (UPF0299 family)
MLLADAGLKAAFTKLDIPFPHTLAGMLAVIGALVLAKALKGPSGKAADAVVDFFGPLRDWVARWMPVFFVPALIALPLSTAQFAASDLVKLAQVTGLGWISSLLVVVIVLKLARRIVNTEITREEVRSTAAHAQPGHWLWVRTMQTASEQLL